MGTDGARMAPWVSRAVGAAPDDPVLDRLTVSLAAELAALWPGTAFDVQRRDENLLVRWSGGPDRATVADVLDIDPLGGELGAVGSLYGEDLPDELRTVAVVLLRAADQ